MKRLFVDSNLRMLVGGDDATRAAWGILINRTEEFYRDDWRHIKDQPLSQDRKDRFDTLAQTPPVVSLKVNRRFLHEMLNQLPKGEQLTLKVIPFPLPGVPDRTVFALACEVWRSPADRPASLPTGLLMPLVED